MTNLLRAIQCIVKNPASNLLDRYQSKDEINNSDIPLEELIKDIFANTLDEYEEGNTTINYFKPFVF